MANLECRMYEKEFPEVDTTVMVRITSSNPDCCAYVSLLEYGNMEGMITHNELSRKRIRSHSAVVTVGRREPVMVLDVEKDKKHINLSKKKVSEEDIEACEERYNKSKHVHSILRHVAEILNIDLQVLHENVGWPLYRKYGHGFEAFKLIARDPDLVFDWLEDNGPVGEKEAMRKANAAGTEDCPVVVRIVAAPLYAFDTQTLDKDKGISILSNAIAACTKELELHKGKVTVTRPPRTVNEQDEKRLFADDTLNPSDDEEEDGEISDEEDTGMGELNNSNWL